MSFGDLPVPAVLAAQFVVLTTTGAVFGESRWRRALAWSLAISGIALPLLMVDVPAMRAISALFSLFGPMRAIELSLRRTTPAWPVRAATFLLPLDTRTLRSAPPALDATLLGQTALHAIIGALGVTMVVLAPETGALAIALRLAGGLVALYGLVDAISGSIRLVLALLGAQTTPVQIHPILAESAGEFWGRRWNRAVGEWLRHSCFMPVARRFGVRWGALAAFGASATIHFVPVLIALGPWPAIASGAYFLIEGLLVMVEGRLHVSRWPRPARHGWTFVGVVGPSPLFVIPVLQVFGGW